MKIVLAGSVKFTLTKEKKLRKEKKAYWDIQVVFLELWLLVTSIVLLPIRSSFFFYLFNRLFLAYWWIHWISSFLYLYRNQSINFLITISWLVSVWVLSTLWVLYGYIGNIWITEISILSLFNFFVGVFVFIINLFFSLKDFIAGSWLELYLFAMLILLCTESFSIFSQLKIKNK